MYVKFQKQLGHFSEGIEFPFYALPHKIMFWWSQKWRESNKPETWSVSNRHEQQKQFLKLQCRFFCMGM
jgi:hypothetical protein